MKVSFLYIFIGVVVFSVPFSLARAQNITATSFSYPQETISSKNPVMTPSQSSMSSRFVSPRQTSTNTTRKSVGTTANQVNLEIFINKVRSNGKNIPEIEGIINQMRTDVATTTDLTSLFLKQPGLIPLNSKITQETPLKRRIASLIDIFKPKQVSAVSTLPFGGPLLYSYFCTCSYTWLIWVGPTVSVGTSNMILDYVPFSQGFLNYNIPYTTNLMGKYSPSSSMCYIYYGYGCINLPVSYGMITPIVGSSTY